ncbi:N-acetylmuramoyl-L-alanine amidase [Corynebacterium sp. TAE3-ERU2]|uniref:peptidoglycan recognition protein family protein n=1 Tax=Corynebacterium sp. TAE3-ERU2 TaxID=2849497 RepID=UPI001C43D0D8|nr:N-acetylmuramoyl-L-alanine amidase [Corynebacterium sp. TAE3-ERU2]MBV7302941.1 N-acetylmuramoyl-L-alanine amidase [Corynebacterium sp. TAE3-ERU2]
MAITKPSPGRRGDPVWLPEVLRLWGVTVKELPGWRDRGQGDFDDIVGVMCHHTGSATTPPSLIANGHSALRGLLSQIHLSPDGVATICGAGIAYHAGAADPGRGGVAGEGYVRRRSVSGVQGYTSGNAKLIGIEAQHAGTHWNWPEPQLRAYALCCAAICWYLGLPVKAVMGHKEYAPSRKIDPTISMEGFRRRVAELLANPPAAVRNAGRPSPAPVEKKEKAVTTLDTVRKSQVKGSMYEAPLADYIMHIDNATFETRALAKDIGEQLTALSKAMRALDDRVTAVDTKLQELFDKEKKEK